MGEQAGDLDQAGDVEQALAVLDQGEGPAVLVVPGATFPAASWQPLVDRLSGMRVLVVDLPGHGASPAWPLVRPEGVAAACAALVRTRGLGAPLVVGHSWGALAAAAYAGLAPVRGLVTLDQGLDPSDLPVPPAGLPPGAAEAAAPRLLAAIEASLHPEALPPSVGELLARVRPRDPAVLVPMLRALEGSTAEQLLAPARAGLAALARSGTPVVHVRRSDDDARRGDVREWAGRSHCVHLEHTDRLVALLQEAAWTRGGGSV